MLLEHRPTGRIYMTTRLGGDERLCGQASIGLGGHVEEGECVMDALYRELEEEIGLSRVELAGVEFCGFIRSELNEVDSVHIGLVYRAYTDREDVSCRERDKLAGGWFTAAELQEARRSGHMESWSALCFDELLEEVEER